MGCVMMSVEGCIYAEDAHVIKIMCHNNCAPYHDFDDYFFFARVIVQYYTLYCHCPLLFSGTVPKFQTRQFQRLLIVTSVASMKITSRVARRSFVMMTVFYTNEYYIPIC